MFAINICDIWLVRNWTCDLKVPSPVHARNVRSGEIMEFSNEALQHNHGPDKYISYYSF